jgi:phytoene dehydrogenase-like protein
LYRVAESFQNIAVIGAAINGLVAANYVQRAEHQVTLLDRADRS